MSIKAVQSLAVKYRPKKFKDLVGHEAIVSQLEGMLKSGRIPGALLFVGDTGVGKTTIARMFSKYLNCENMTNCGECKGCLEAESDFEEINIADKKKIDDIRSLIQKSRNRPRFGRFRIFMLDEVHQLTGDSEKALLKPLEEPPPHTLWILATSEPSKVAPEVIGRCNAYRLNNPSKEDIAKRLKKIAKKEEVKVGEEVLLSIAELSGGHVRNAISLLDSCLFYLHSNPKANTQEILSSITQGSLASFDSDMEKMAFKTLIGIYSKGLKTITTGLLGVKSDYIPFVNVMLSVNQYMIDTSMVSSHPNIWHTSQNRRFKDVIKTAKIEVNKNHLIKIQSTLIRLRQDLQTLSVPERYQLSATLLKLRTELKND